MITIVDTGMQWVAYLPEGMVGAASLPELIFELYKQRDNFESEKIYNIEESNMPKSALKEYADLAAQMSSLAEQIINTGPKMANLLLSNDISGIIGSMDPGTMIEELDMSAGRIQELQAGWAAIFKALNTPVEVYPGYSATPVQIIYRRGTPKWVEEYSLSKETLTEE